MFFFPPRAPHPPQDISPFSVTVLSNPYAAKRGVFFFFYPPFPSFPPFPVFGQINHGPRFVLNVILVVLPPLASCCVGSLSPCSFACLNRISTLTSPFVFLSSFMFLCFGTLLRHSFFWESPHDTRAKILAVFLQRFVFCPVTYCVLTVPFSFLLPVSVFAATIPHLFIGLAYHLFSQVFLALFFIFFLPKFSMHRRFVAPLFYLIYI